MKALRVEIVPVLSDNYVFLAHDPDSGATAAVDPAVAGPVLEALARLDWSLSHILCTHHHGDHTGGNQELKRATGCAIVAGQGDADRIPGVDRAVKEGDTVALGEQSALVLEVPGHTRGHVAYWFSGSRVLFSGDTLFSLGCGRLFEGTAEQMWRSLERLRALPDDALVYCAHEYTNANADFALTQDPDNPSLLRHAGRILELRQTGRPTVPSQLGLEKALNPFLRADDPELLRAAGLEGLPPVRAFAEIRARKDRF